MRRAENLSLSCCRLFPAARGGCFSWKAAEPSVLLAALPSAQHKKHNTTQRERSRTAVRTLQVYLTRFRSEDLFWGDRSPGTSRWKLCPQGTAPAVHLSSGIATRPRSGQGVQQFHKQLLCTPQAMLEPVSPLVLTKGWRALAEAGITLPKLPVLQQQKGSQSCSSSGLSQVSPAF